MRWQALEFTVAIGGAADADGWAPWGRKGADDPKRSLLHCKIAGLALDVLAPHRAMHAHSIR